MKKAIAESQTARGLMVVRNDRGLHTRPSTEIVKCMSNFKSKIKLRYHKQEVNAKSMLGILMLAAAKGARITIEAEGADAQDAVGSLIALSRQNFNVSY